jgi:ParB family transcriptional regulator, chromosome partitioning protein
MLMGDSAGPAPESVIQVIPMDLLTPGPFQPRRQIDPAELAELAASIREQGVLQPVLARPTPGEDGKFQIIAGERRWRAAQQAGLHEIPALVLALDDREAMTAALVENLQRENLNPIDEAEGYRRLVEDFALTQEVVADRVGKSRSHVANTLRLLKLPAPVHHELRRGTISAGHARALLLHPDPARATLAVIAQGLNVRQTEALSSRKDPPPAGEPRPKDPDTLSLERELTEKLGLAVDIRRRGRGGSLALRYDTLEQLEGIVLLLTRV